MMLRACPFCGNRVQSDKSMRTLKVVRVPRTKGGYGLEFEQPKVEYYVKCGNCGARSGSVFAGYNALTKRTTTEAQAERLAVEKWRKRREQ